MTSKSFLSENSLAKTNRANGMANFALKAELLLRSC